MAVKIVRKRRKNADGSYDIVHYETQAKAVWFADGESFQQKCDNGELTGPPGPAPIKGTDYFTADDRTEMVEEVLNAMPESGGGTAKTEIKTWTGRGEGYPSEASPLSITFSFAPKVVLILGAKAPDIGALQPFYSIYDFAEFFSVGGDSYYSYVIIPELWGTTYALVPFGGWYVDFSNYQTNMTIEGKKSADGKTFSWYCTDESFYKPFLGFDGADGVYYALAIG